MKKKLLATLLALCMVLSLVPTTVVTASAATNPSVSYLSPVYKNSSKPEEGITSWQTLQCTDYTYLTASTTALPAGTYVVSGTVANEYRLKVTGEVKLILMNFSNATLSGGIAVTGDNDSLTIYAQSTDAGEMGTLTAGRKGDAINVSKYAGIGGTTDSVNGKNITINGGNITAQGGFYCAGIGGAIGGNCENVVINGGNVTAIGGANSALGGAGIGGGTAEAGAGGSCTGVVINGGDVIADGADGSLAIGGAYGSSAYGTTTGIYINTAATNEKTVSVKGRSGNVSVGTALLDITDENSDGWFTNELCKGAASIVYLEITENPTAHYHNKGTADEICFDVGLTQANIGYYLSDEDTEQYFLAQNHNYYLAESIVTDCCICINGGCNICLNGYTLSTLAKDCTIKTVCYNEKVSVDDCNSTKKTHYYTVDGNGVWQWDDSNTASATPLASLTAIPQEGAVISIAGGAITGGSGNSVGYGGGIYNYAGNLCLYGGTIVGNAARGTENDYEEGKMTKAEYDVFGGSGGGIAVNFHAASFEMNGGAIVGNTATYGAGLFSGNAVTVKAGRISFNTSKYSTGGVYFEADETNFTMSGGEISYNKGSEYGGVCMNDGYFTMTGGAIKNNIAYDSATKVYRYSGVYLSNSVDEITLGGTAYIYDNNGANLHLIKNKTYNYCVTVDATTPLTEGAKIGVTLLGTKVPTANNPIAVTTTNSADYSAYFVSDNKNYSVYSFVSADGSDADTLPDQVVKLTVNALYTITWKNGDTTLATTKSAQGETPVYPNAAPTGTGTFTGWATIPNANYVTVIPAATADATYYAVFGSTTIGPSGVKLNKNSVTLNMDETETLTATVSPSTAADKSVTWASGNTDIATVDANGKITAVGAGTTTITVTTTVGGLTDTCQVTVQGSAVAECKFVASLTLTKNIDLNFKMANLGTGFDKTKLVINVDGNAISTDAITYSETENYATCVLKSYDPNEIGTAVTVNVTYDGQPVKEFTYSVLTYCNAVFASQDYGESSDLGKLCTALLNYGKYTADYVNGNDNSTLNEGHAVTFASDYSFTNKVDSVIVDTGTVAGGHYFHKAAVTIGSTVKLQFRIYRVKDKYALDNSSSKTQNFFVLNSKDEQINPKNVAVTQDGNYTVVTIEMYASQLSNSYTLKIKDVDTSKFCITYGVYNYCAGQQLISKDTRLKTLCMALHNYGEAVQNYIASTK